MFGMLDYRAHKLYWLLSLPFRLLARAMFFVAVAIGVIVGMWWSDYNFWIKIVIGYVIFELSVLILNMLFSALIIWPFNKVFFWTVDVIPSKGRDYEEAKEAVIHGPVFWLAKKFTSDIENWTDQDTEAFASSLYNWRAKWFFQAREKFYKRVSILQQNFFETGRQPVELRDNEINELVGHLEPNWFGKAIIWPHTFNALMGLWLIVLAIFHFSR